MQSGIDSSRVFITASNGAAVLADTPTQTAKNDKEEEFFGADGPSFRDVLDAINPLNHIPIISDLFASATDHTPSSASKLAGGAIMGGPIGFIASLANVIFEQATGSSPAQALVAALSGDAPQAEIQVASNEAVPAGSSAPESLNGPASITPTYDPTSRVPAATAQLASLNVGDEAPTADKAVLDLYGSSPASMHASYRKAQLRPYLQDVNHTKVI